jgi:hypothetical protein
VTIEILSDDALLNLFRHYVNVYPRFWPMLAHVCQRWRRIIFESPRGLDLRLYCTYGTPVLKTLEYWPPLPLVLNYGGSPELNPPAPEDEKNIMAALKQSDHVRFISLTVTTSLVEKLSTISEPITELEEINLLSRDDLQLTLPDVFRSGPRLRTLRSTRIAIPALPQLLSPPTGLVELQLHEIPKLGYFCPKAFANALSGATRLETLSLHFHSLPPRRNHLRMPLRSDSERTVLSALTFLKYRGTSKFLDSFVARIDAPRLEDIDITFSSQPTMDASQLGRFIERTEMQISLLQADIVISTDAISISFTSSSTSTPLRLQIPCKQLDWKLSSMTQVCDRFSPFLFRVNNLGVNATQLSSERDEVDGEQWLALFRVFCGARSLWITGELTSHVLCALGKTDGDVSVLLDLRHLRVGSSLAIYGPSWDAVQSFLTWRWASGHPLQINAPSYLCHICRGTFEQKEELRNHLVYGHTYGIKCFYCSYLNFMQVLPRHEELLREHLTSKHVYVPPTDSLPASDLFELFTRLVPSILSDETGTSKDADTDADTDIE